MTPKKAIIIIFILFLVLVVAFVVLYISNKPVVDQTAKPADSGGINSAGLTEQEKSSQIQQKIKVIETKTNDQVKQIIDQGTTATGGITVDAQRKIEEAVNQAMVEKAKLKTPEQIKADEQRQAELEKIEQQVNQQIRSKRPTK